MLESFSINEACSHAVILFLNFKYFHFCEEAEWAVETLKKTGKPIIASLCVGPDGDHHGISTEECAVRLIEAGTYYEKRLLHILKDERIKSYK